MKLKTMNKLIVVSSLLTISPTISKAEAVYMCEPCPAGYSCNKGVKTPCPAGTFAQAGARECSKCPEGKYQNATGQSSCLTCSPKTEYCNYEYTVTGSCRTDDSCYLSCIGCNGCPGHDSLSCSRRCNRCDSITKTRAGHINITMGPNSDRTACVEISRSECLDRAP